MSAPTAPPRRRFRTLPDWAGPATRTVHGGRRPDLNAGAVVAPIYQTSTYRYPAAYSEAAAAGEVHLYSRHSNPTVAGAAEVIRQLEGAEAARLFASGMGAIHAVLWSLLNRGDPVVALGELYGGTTDLLRDFASRFGIGLHELTPTEAREAEPVVAPGTRLLWLESPTNPTLGVVDLARWSEAAHRVGAVVVVDNTFATPINQRPLNLGADLVVHSATKYLGGHSDLLAGAVVGSAAAVDRIDPQSTLGAPLDPFAAFLLERSLKTLDVRMARHNATGAAVARALVDHPAVARVGYPGWGSPAEETIAAAQMRGRGGMVAVSLRGGAAALPRFLAHLQIVEVATSLGGVESLASVPAETSHRRLSPAERTARGIDPGLVRLSLGLEEPDDLIRDLREALDRSAVG